MLSRFSRFAWFVLLYNLAVIVWGAYVRATGSGAGCGEHWPLCNGVVIPRAPSVQTMIEFSHRITSGLALVLVILLVVLAWRWFPKGHLLRRGSMLALIFTITEALIGAGLVLLGHVAANQSLARGWSLSLHLVNTMILVACLAATAWIATRKPVETPAERPGSLRVLLAVGAVLFLLAGVSGAVAALGDTLFKADSLAEGIRQDFDPMAHPFVRLRVLHPIFAVTTGVVFFTLGLYFLTDDRWKPLINRLSTGLIGLTLAQIFLGLLNLTLLAPVWLQLVHLLSADLLWICFVVLATESYLASEPSSIAQTELASAGRLPSNR
jgi:heme A synthase